MGACVSRLTDLLHQARGVDPQLAADLETEINALMKRRTFGLVFERHRPEAVELPGHPVRRGDKVRVLPPRGSTKPGDQRLWRVERVERVNGSRVAHLRAHVGEDRLAQTALVEDVVVVAEFQDRIYPGLMQTDDPLPHGGDKPFHTIITAENYHALQLLTYTHRGRVDCALIDPPYNSGAKDWKYNNRYVAKDDAYRHSKWLAFMERRLLLVRELLNPDHGVLIVTIDEKEYARLALLLEQTFPEARIQMVSSVINPKGSARAQAFRRTDEYLFFVKFGSAAPARLELGPEWSSSANVSEGEALSDDPGWGSMMRRGTNSARSDRPRCFYPIYVDPTTTTIAHIGDRLPEGESTPPAIEGLVATLPIRKDRSEGRWQVSAAELAERLKAGRVRVGRRTHYGYVINYLSEGAYADVLSGKFEVIGRAKDGSLITRRASDEGDKRVAPTQWKLASHNASEHGKVLLNDLLPGRSFPFPKSLYAMEDVLRFHVADQPDAVVLDFFAGSGTTAHAVMRLNRQDGGRRQCISITNNEVSAGEQTKLRKKGLRPGDAAWEEKGICDHITKPRIKAAITGRTPGGKPIDAEYRHNDEFPMSEGLQENAAFFTMTYEQPLSVRHHRAFERVAPMLWLRAGSVGPMLTDLGEDGWAISETYGVLEDLDNASGFLQAVSAEGRLTTAFIVTDDESAFQMVCRNLPDGVEPVRLYESYLTNFEINAGAV